MKHIALFLGIASALVASCSVQEDDFVTPQQNDVFFYASFEQPSEETRVYANENLLLRWTADDRVSIFNNNTYNQEYQFIGETGDYEGGFNKVGDPEFITGDAIPHIISVYPFQRQTRVSENEVVTVTLPTEQVYAPNSFGLGANTMVSVSSGNLLKYRNVGGYLMLKLYGEGVSVSSITLKGNNNEKLAGKANVTMPLEGTPSAMMAADATTTITLTCETPVQLGASAEESTQFWFVVPPVNFSKGFQITVSGNGGVFDNSTEKTVTIERNNLSKMAPIEVALSQPKNVIYYTSSDGNIITPYNTNAFGVSIISNEYVDGLGVLTFDGDVKGIGASAFDGCKSLTSITIPDSVRSIGSDAFYNCTSLTSITIPDSVRSIGSNAFYNCYSLTSITIPDSVTRMGSHAFCNCTSLTSITIPDSVTSIGDHAFYNCTSLTSITIPDSVTSIGSNAFDYCTSLTSITIPDGVTSIGDRAFHYCTSLTSITIPDSVTSIGEGAFANCTSLVSFAGQYASQDGLFLIDYGSIIAIALGSFGGDISIPYGVTSIGNYVFFDCTSLTSITISDGVTSIGDYAFAYCKSLTSVTVPDSVTSIGDNAFDGCKNLTSITIPDSVMSIGNNAFAYCSSLTSITVPDSVTRIGDHAFAFCYSLTSITIPDSVTSIENSTFFYCKSLTSITIPNSVRSIGDSAFNNCTSLRSITLPDSVTSIGDNAFYYCYCLTSITVKGELPPTGGRNMFLDTNSAPIYVPAASVEAYKSAQYWNDYADRIQAVSE